MNKKIIGVVVAVLIIGSIIAYFAYGNKSAVEKAGENSQNTKTNQSLGELIASGGSQKCTFSDTSVSEGASQSTEGVVYIVSGKMRGDFNSTVSGNISRTHMIVDGGVSYVWVDGVSSGFKSEVKASNQVGQNTNMKSIDIDKKADYRCEPWATDASMFVIPTNIQFNDLSSFMFKG